MKNVNSELSNALKKQRHVMNTVLDVLAEATESNANGKSPGVAITHVLKAMRILKAALKPEDAAKADTMLALETMDGENWGKLLSCLVAKHGSSAFRTEDHKGKRGCLEYLHAARALVAHASIIKPVGKPAYSQSAVASIDIDIVSVNRLLDAAEAACIAATGMACNTIRQPEARFVRLSNDRGDFSAPAPGKI